MKKQNKNNTVEIVEKIEYILRNILKSNECTLVTKILIAESGFCSDILYEDPSVDVRAAVARGGQKLKELKEDGSIFVMTEAIKANCLLKSSSNINYINKMLDKNDLNIVLALILGLSTHYNSTINTSILSKLTDPYKSLFRNLIKYKKALSEYIMNTSSLDKIDDSLSYISKPDINIATKQDIERLNKTLEELFNYLKNKSLKEFHEKKEKIEYIPTAIVNYDKLFKELGEFYSGNNCIINIKNVPIIEVFSNLINKLVLDDFDLKDIYDLSIHIININRYKYDGADNDTSSIILSIAQDISAKDKPSSKNTEYRDIIISKNDNDVMVTDEKKSVLIDYKLDLPSIIHYVLSNYYL